MFRTSGRPILNVVTGEPLFGPALQADPWPVAREQLGSWLSKVGVPARGDPQRVAAGLDRFGADPGSGPAERLLEILGLMSPESKDALKLWKGAIGFWTYSAQRDVGHRRLEMGFQDWFAGQTRGGIGLWSREHGRDSVETAPDDAENTARFGRIVHDRVIQPVLESTTLPGRRFWSTHQPPNSSPDVSPSDPLRVVAHISPKGALGVFIAFPEPATHRVFAPGQPVLLNQLWPSEIVDGVVTRSQLVLDLLPADSDADLLQAASLSFRSGAMTDWQPVAETVEPTLLATCSYVRSA